MNFFFLQRLIIFFYSQRLEEMRALSGPNEFSEFYERLKDIKDHHRKFPNEPAEPLETDFIQSNQEKEEEDFEGIENRKKCRQYLLIVLLRIGKVILW
jgi:hypothetical protein